MTEPSSQAGAGDTRPSQNQPRPAAPGVRINSPSVVPQGPAAKPVPAQPPVGGRQPASSAQPPRRTAATGPAGGTGRAAPPSEDLFAGSAASSGDDTPNRSRNLMACGGCLLLALLLALGAFLGYQWLKPAEGGYERPTTPTAEQTEGGGEEQPSEEQPSEPVEEVSPAPEGAIEMNALVSPSGNIHCTLEGDDVACSMADHRLENNTDGQCSNDEPFAVRVGADGDPQLDCGQSLASDSTQELSYGDSAKSGNVACTSEESGMTCWNARTGKGFIVARDTYETF
ncbi:hypothetical protein [Brachybacterium sp. p3-SID957]|uniref:hypothetical protein n=1 Tax=Brachybacterium sp. p3-SID957 TaxID=2916049 RepID=UPI00223C4499|nr:hypothetical protein [Brachybacterium sp. p3-SID957]MCT1774477.1 hypothetical protein [Brachybacterium sp. p3-SID957]